MATQRPLFGEFTEEILAKAVKEREKRERVKKEAQEKAAKKEVV